MLGFISAFIIASSSMRPSLFKGDVVFTCPTRYVKSGDIITFKRQDTIVTHRALETARTIITKGDANGTPDQVHISKQDVIGKVCFVLPFGRMFHIFFTSA
ncbi:signal peptidase I [Candidatus Roizmanbacteria bacterium RIFCSPLOWO2_01_FULL_42_14]|uniref:Signal peptidase I n=3 Tax=Candidatus Roizmaniibacteriota TaxID=1752723 RepID=A0A1F7K050_9BACT|nr:MAG: signal peptidase I [Candidatus Roizmanbacteria bacterium RIFCSPHIGHO2_02_FULL_43_11]OGK51378.1 MAG: signal peptidase I [Candidatus Roizmanbacteria bacterium RIFCSPLOWO2_01_FULL_42_14]OGK61221.1 MAG: signal peptidase I [Candidatus Roizmanbacteria bacterium RIFCSPLOWO2_02_FULL_43_10]